MRKAVGYNYTGEEIMTTQSRCAGKVLAGTQGDINGTYQLWFSIESI